MVDCVESRRQVPAVDTRRSPAHRQQRVAFHCTLSSQQFLCCDTGDTLTVTVASSYCCPGKTAAGSERTVHIPSHCRNYMHRHRARNDMKHEKYHCKTNAAPVCVCLIPKHLPHRCFIGLTFTLYLKLKFFFTIIYKPIMNFEEEKHRKLTDEKF